MSTPPKLYPEPGPPPPLPLEAADPETLKFLERQQREELDALAQLRKMRLLVSLSGLAGAIISGLVAWKLFNWHLAPWIECPEMGAGTGVAAAIVARLVFIRVDVNERLEGAYSARQRLDLVSHGLGVLLIHPLLLLLIGWLLKVLL